MRQQENSRKFQRPIKSLLTQAKGENMTKVEMRTILTPKDTLEGGIIRIFQDLVISIIQKHQTLGTNLETIKMILTLTLELDQNAIEDFPTKLPSLLHSKIQTLCSKNSSELVIHLLNCSILIHLKT